jgi:hypothetical protein
LARTRDIHWVAGLIEGDGCFFIRRGKYNSGTTTKYREYPGIDVTGTDEDVIRRAHDVLGGTFTTWNRKTAAGKTVYCVRVRGRLALAWMMTLYPLMGNRRRGKIMEILTKWRSSPLKVGLSPVEVKAA